MKNEMIVNASGGLELLSSIDNGDNSLIINGSVVPVSDWIGSGNYTFTVNDITYTIVKAASQGGNWQLIQDTDFTYHFQNARSKTQEIIDLIYPVGSIYMSINAVNPANLFGGTWEQIKDRFLLSAGDNYNNGSTGGEATHLLTAAESGQKAGSTVGENATHSHNPSTTSEYFVTCATSEANNTRVAYSGSGNRLVDGMTNTSSSVFHHRKATDSQNANHAHSINGSDATTAHNNMPPYLAVNIWKRIA